MLDKLLDRIARFAMRHERLLNLAAVGWFALTCAAYARFIDLPDIPYVTDRNAWMISAPYNAIWWGWLRPKIAARRERRIDAPPGRAD